mgnify:CR=1 FL=1
MVSILKFLDLRIFRTKPILLKKIRIPASTIDFIDEDLGISSALFDSGYLNSTTLSHNGGNFYEKFNIIRTDDYNKSFMIVTESKDETRLYRDLSVQSNDAISIRKIIRSKLHLRIILMDEEDNDDE